MSKLTLERIFSNPDLNGLSPTGISFSPDGNQVTYLLGSSENDQRLDLWLYDISENRSNLLVSSADLDSGRVLSDEDKDRRERKRIDNSGIVEYQWSPSGEAILIPLGEVFIFCICPQEGLRRLSEMNNMSRLPDIHRRANNWLM